MTDRSPRTGRELGGLAGANLVAMGLGFVANILITGLLPVDQYGEYRLAIIAAALVVGATNFGFHVTTARALAGARSTLSERFVMGVGLSLVTTLLLATTLLCVAVVVVLAFLQSEYSELGMMVAIVLLPLGLQRALIYVLRGSRKLSELISQVALQPIFVCVAWGVVSLGGGALARVDIAVAIYVGGFLIAHVLSFVRLHPILPHRLCLRWRELAETNRLEGWQVYKGSLVGVVSADLVVVVVGLYVSAADFGVYALAISLASPLLQIPITFQALHFRDFVRSGRLRESVVMGLLGLGFLCLGAGVGLLWLIEPVIYAGGYPDLLAMVGVVGASFAVHGVGDYVNGYLIGKGAASTARVSAYVAGLSLIAGAGILVVPFGVWGLALARCVSSTAYLSVGLGQAKALRRLRNA